MKIRIHSSIRAGLAAAILLSLAACGKEQNVPATTGTLPTATIRAATATATETKRYQDTVGTVVAVDRAALAPKVMGTVESIPVALGQRVAKGDLLVKISAREIEARLEQARAGSNQAARDLTRESTLLEKGASTRQIVNDLQDRDRQMRAMVAEAETMLGYTRITAPFDGIVSRKLVNEGDLASPGEPVIEIDGGSRLRVEAGVAESLASIPLGTEIPMSSEGGSITGTLAEISSSSDPMSRTVLAKFDLPSGAAVRPGEFVKVGIPAGSTSPILVPAAAVSRRGQIERVHVIRDGRAVMRIVRTGARFGDDLEITAGLDAGEIVATEGVETLRDGQPVEVRP